MGLRNKFAAVLPILALSSPVSASENCNFDLYKHLGNLSPYFVPQNTPASLKSGVPPGCSVDKAFLIHRHGSRQPLSNEVVVIQDLAYYINNNTALFSQPQGQVPSAFSFLANGWNSTFGINDLTAPGRQQLFDHGVALKLKYPDLYTDVVLVGNQDRVVESAQWFMDGYYGRSVNSTATMNLINEDDETVSWITAMDTCTDWDYDDGNDLVVEWDSVYLPPIAERINSALEDVYPGVNFTADNVHGMLYACAYGTAVYGVGSSPWCSVFSPDEILNNEYEYDLLMRGAFGYGLPGTMGPVLGAMLVANVTTFLQEDDDSTAPNLSLNFGHDTTIDLGLTALGLAYDASYPVDGPVNATRAWRTANQVPFAAQMLWSKLSCGEESRVQLLLNEANFDLSPTGCESDEYGTCTLDAFVNTEKVQTALGVTYGDDAWDSACSA
ncbi:histidine phosphatase superfamily [Xylariales sp. PMI_506]|nr:histidine phosphatase superfamily [Xylariales sp. PMI_506]